MKAIVVREFGGPEVMKLEEIPAPKPGPGQVVVRMKAAGVNPADTYMRSGNYSNKPPLPYTPGTDGAGVIDSVGTGVTRVKTGDRVYTARTVSGTYAECALALDSQVQPLPERISWAQGAAIFVPYATGYRALEQVAHARAGETLLVHGASGMVVIGTAGTDKGRALALREGAHHVVDHGAAGYADKVRELTAGRGVDVILEMLANVNLGTDLQ